MKKKIIQYILIGILMLLSGSIIIFGFLEKYISKTDIPIYEIAYYDDYIPGLKIDIVVYETKIKITKTSFCSTIDCKPNKEKTINFNYYNIVNTTNWMYDKRAFKFS